MCNGRYINMIMFQSLEIMEPWMYWITKTSTLHHLDEMSWLIVIPKRSISRTWLYTTFFWYDTYFLDFLKSCMFPEGRDFLKSIIMDVSVPWDYGAMDVLDYKDLHVDVHRNAGCVGHFYGGTLLLQVWQTQTGERGWKAWVQVGVGISQKAYLYGSPELSVCGIFPFVKQKQNRNEKQN